MDVLLPVSGLTARRRSPGRCCEAPVPDLDAERASELAAVAKALADPKRMQIVDAVRKSTPEPLCQCELSPLFDMSQPALSKHLKVLVDAGVLGSEKQGVWTYYYERPAARKEFLEWLS